MATLRDITERKRVEEALAESENRLRFAFEGANDGLWDVQMQTGAVYLSPRGCEILGYRPEELPEIAKVWNDLVHPDDLPETQRWLQAHLEGSTPVFQVEQRLRTKSGAWKWVLARGKVVTRDATGGPLRMTGTHTDITDRKLADTERRQLTAQLHQSQKLESLGSLAGGVAHDINNVLAAILGLASGHRERLGPADPMARPLDTITSACLRGRDVVKSLLYFARKDLETFGPVDLNGIVREMVQLLESTTLKRIPITTELEAGLAPIDGDAGALSHSLMNLCLNALDAMPGGGTLRIRTRGRGDGGLELSVRDTGEGMTEAVIKQAIEPFFTTKAAGKGTGLGLAMVYGTVQAHKGTFAMHSEPGQGTEITLSFPGSAQALGGASRLPEPGHGGPDKALRILLVDDDELIRNSLAPMLEMVGLRVWAAADGLAGLAQLEQGLEVDRVILDLNMPGLSGLQTLPRILALRPLQRVLIGIRR